MLQAFTKRFCLLTVVMLLSVVNALAQDVIIGSVADLIAFRNQVNDKKDNFAGKTVLLTADLDLSNENWIPIGLSGAYYDQKCYWGFQGTFDGQNHTISNLTIDVNGADNECAAFFGCLNNATIKNLTLKDVNIKGKHYAAGFMGNSFNSPRFENCHVIGGTITSTAEKIDGVYDNGDKVGGIVGRYQGNSGCIKNCSVENVTLSGYRDLGGIVGMSDATVDHCTVKNVTINQDNTHNYKGYTDNSKFSIGQIVGTRSTEAATVNISGNETYNNTWNNVTINYGVIIPEVANVAKIGNEEYATLQAAVDAATAGQTIELLQDIDLTTVTTNPSDKYNVEINKSITIDGKGFKITGTQGKRPLVLTGEGNNITLKNLTVINNKGDATLWIANALTCTLDKTVIDGTYAVTYNQPITIGQFSDAGRVVLNVTNGSVIKTNDDAKAHYAIIAWHPADIDVTESTIKGWAAVYVKPDAAGTNVSISNSTLESHGYSGVSNAFGMFVTESDGNSFTLSNNSYKLTPEDNYDVLFMLNGHKNNTIQLLGSDNTFVSSDQKYGGLTFSWGDFYANSLYMSEEAKNLLASYIDSEATINQVTEEPYNGLYKIGYVPEVYYYWNTTDGQDGGYYDFSAPFVNGWLANGEFIDLLKNITLSDNITCKLTAGSFEFTQGEYSVTKGDYSVLLHKGVSVNTDKETDIFASADEDGVISMTVANNVYTYTCTEVPAVAQIDDVKYASLAEAIADVPTDGTQTTITMLADETVAANGTMTIATGKNIVLDLNGKTISGSNNVAGNFYFIINNGTLEVTDNSEEGLGKISFKSTLTDFSNERVALYNENGTLTLTKGTIENTSAGGMSYAVKNSSNTWAVAVSSTFNMNGGKISAPNGDAALRVYQNCSASSPMGKNYVNITGGTIDAAGIFVDTYLYKENIPANYAGSNIDTKINISGGTIKGLIDMKIRHPFNTVLNITGGEFANTKMWVRKYGSEYAVAAEPTSPMVTISGGTFNFVDGKAFGLAYDCAASSWTSYEKPYGITGGTYSVDPTTFVSTGFKAVAKDDKWTVTGNGEEFNNDVKDENNTVVAKETVTVSEEGKATIKKVTIEQTGVKNVTVSAAIGSAEVTTIADDAFKSLAGSGVQTIDLSSTKVELSGSRVGHAVLGDIPETALIYLPSGNTVTGTNVVIKKENAEEYTCASLVMQDQQDYSVPTAFTAETATLNRSFTADVPSTLCLPYDVPAGNITGKIYRFASIDLKACTITMTEDADGLDANVPYIFMPNAGTNSISASNIDVEMETPQTTQGTFTFVGVFEKKEFTDDECNTGVYGYAGQVKDGYTVGQFAKGGKGAYVAGMRAYLIYTGGESLAPGLNGAAAATSLPSRFNVQLQNANGETTEILNLDMETAEDGSPVYNLSGQRVNNAQKGIYIKNGKKVIIK